ncbi:MAG: NAD(P)H-hydrate dehydratase [Bacteroidota bacterium]
MKVLSAAAVRQLDQETIKRQKISSAALMERASSVFVEEFLGRFPTKMLVYVFCGTGNNGGDGMVITRLLREQGWKVEVFVLGSIEKGSPDFRYNLSRVGEFSYLKEIAELPKIARDGIIIDALFGSGLSRPIAGIYKDLIVSLNQQSCIKIAVDMPSGLFMDQCLPSSQVAFKANHTFSFQLPKLPFFMADCHEYVGEWHLLDIGLDEQFQEDVESNTHFTIQKNISGILPKRKRFTHKNEVGRLQVVGGQKGMMGAVTLTSLAALRAGVGLLKVTCPSIGLDVLQIALPEAMVEPDNDEDIVTELRTTENAIVIGPGLGIDARTQSALIGFLKIRETPVVIDADAINILASHMRQSRIPIPENSILTPHPGEFRRLVGSWENEFQKIEMLRSFCLENKINVVLKGAFSAVCSSSGDVYFNSSGNPALATAGSGDVLAGVVGSLLAQGLKSIDALKLGVYAHGLAADLWVQRNGAHGLIASDIVDMLPFAFSRISSLNKPEVN